MLARSALLLCTLTLSLLPAATALAANPHLARGIRLLDRAEDERALAAFQQAVRWKRSTPEELTRAHLYLGITHFNLMQQKDARRHFRAAFQRDASLKLPEGLSPKTVELAESIRAEVKPRPVPTPPGPEPTTAPVTPPVQPPVLPPQPPPQPRRRSSVNWPAWSLGALAVAAAGTGLALALVARSEVNAANDLNVPLPEARTKHDAASTKALAANILFGVGGAAAIASGVLFLVLRDRRPRDTTAGVAPVPGGLMVQVRGVTW